MKLLLDSNVLLRSIFDRTLLTPTVLQLLVDESNNLFVSRATLWELSIKIAKGKLEMPGSSIQYLLDQIERMGMTVVPIENSHILRTGTLPAHHRDPFDRMIVAQAIEEDFAILSSDQHIPLYGAKVVWN